MEMFGVPRVRPCALLASNSPYHLMDAKYRQVTRVRLLPEKHHHYKKLPLRVLISVFL